MFKKSLLATAFAMSIAGEAAAQTTQNLVNQPPDGADLGFLLTDGTILFQGNSNSDWWKLTPDVNGSYVNGTWSQQASLPAGYSPYAFASAVLADGRVVIAGGEYNENVFAFTDLCAIYDPIANTWTEFAAPKGWGFIGDSPATVLPDGEFLVGRKFNELMAALDPATLTWRPYRHIGKQDFNAEEGWTLLPNGTVLTYDVKGAPESEIYSPHGQYWTSAGSTVANLMSPPAVKSIRYGNGKIYHPPGEVGPGILRPDGTVFATGGVHRGEEFGHTAIYTPSPGGTGVGTWAAGPNFQRGDDAADSFAALLPTGNVLVESEIGRLYEFNGTTLTATKFDGNEGSLLVLPTGEVLVGGSFVYRAVGRVNPAWAPVIDTVPKSLSRGMTYVIAGRQFNGMSQAESFGDEFQMATNYPLVRIENNATGHVFYARTHGHSSMGVATGNRKVTTNFDVPATVETGASTLVVVANGIASTQVTVTVN
jgi:hypothetical protein